MDTLFTLDDTLGQSARLKVVGVGGGGGNALNNMISQNLRGVDFIVANTDSQAIQMSRADIKIQLGTDITRGLGAGADPQTGKTAAEAEKNRLREVLADTDMVFITAGMGGGTGTGGAPVIAEVAKELGILTVAVVTKPFNFEGKRRLRQAEAGIAELSRNVDTLIIIPNQNLFRLANEKTTFTEAFSLADDVLYQGVKGVTDLMVRPGLINLDFADVRAVMDEMGKAMMGTGEDSGEDRAIQAAEKAIANPLLDEISLRGAKGVLINITGGHDLTLFELDEAANRIREEVDPDANIIVGSTLDPSMEGMIRVSVVATGIDASENAADMPVPRRSMARPLHQSATMETPIEAPVAAVAPEPSLFADLDARPSAGNTAERFAFAEEDSAEADLPMPAYQPKVEEFEPVSYDEMDDEALESYVAPRAPAPGTPSPETLQRLQAAVNRMPVQPQQRRPETAAQAASEDRPRFGINSLINRMTGHAAAEADHQPARPARQQPSMQAAQPQPAPTRVVEEEDKIEIPAFLRRQAN